VVYIDVDASYDIVFENLEVSNGNELPLIDSSSNRSAENIRPLILSESHKEGRKGSYKVHMTVRTLTERSSRNPQWR